MDTPTSEQLRKLIRRSVERPYEVGYGKPPPETRFKPGQSGNPKGRPRGSGNKAASEAALSASRYDMVNEIILQEANRSIKVNDGDRQVSMPMAQAVMRSISVAAVKGNTRSQKLFTELVGDTEAAAKRQNDEWLKSMIEYKAKGEEELLRRESLGITHLPDLLPHPDDILIDFERNLVTVRGPWDKRQQGGLDRLLTRLTETETELRALLDKRKACNDLLLLEELDGEIAIWTRAVQLDATKIASRFSANCVRRRLAKLGLNPVNFLNAIKDY